MSYFMNRDNQFTLGGKALKAGVYQWSESLNETTDETSYYDGDDELTILRSLPSWSFSYHDKNVSTTSGTVTMDEAAALVWAMRNKTGDDRITTFTWKDVSCTTTSWSVTVSDITVAGGDATGKSGFSFTLHANKLNTESAE